MSEEGIAINTLADILALLESTVIVSKSNAPSHKQKIMYSLIKKGIDLVSVLIEVIMWSAKYDNKPAVDMKFVKAFKKDKLDLIVEISSRLIEELRVS